MSFDACLSNRIGEAKFAAWFAKPTTNVRFAGNHLQISVANWFVRDFIERNFRDAIQAAAQESSGNNVEFTIEVDPSLTGQLIRKDLSENQAPIVRSVSGADAGTPFLKRRFDNFVVGDSNRIAHGAAKKVAENPGGDYNLLFIHGGIGLGKTHLLQAICNRYREMSPRVRWRFLTGADFMQEYVDAVRKSQLTSFVDRYRELEALIIDDIHSLAGKRATQEGFLHVLKTAETSGKEIVVAADAHPKLLESFSEAIVSHFLSGIVARIDAPELEVGTAILRQKAAILDADIDDSVLRYIAERSRSNIRELEGALVKVIAMSKITLQPITMAFVDKSLGEFTHQTGKAPKISDIERAVSVYFGVEESEMHTSRKSKTITLARGVAMYLVRKKTSLSYFDIGRFMGGKNHTTVLLACRRLKKHIDNGVFAQWSSPAGPREKEVAEIVKEIESQIGMETRSGLGAA